ncbi:MAG: SiaB family protein kinase [Pseudomonadota bacterium]
MKKFKLMNFRQQIIENNIVLSFEGQMSQGVLISLVDTLKKKLNEDNFTGNKVLDNYEYLVRKIYAIFVELAQNIQNHSSSKQASIHREPGGGIILIREDKDAYVLQSGNLIEQTKADAIVKKIEDLNLLDDDQLKKLYKQQLRTARNEGKTGAGIGLIDLLRKSQQPLEYEMDNYDEKHQFFTLKVILKKDIQ